MGCRAESSRRLVSGDEVSGDCSVVRSEKVELSSVRKEKYIRDTFLFLENVFKFQYFHISCYNHHVHIFVRGIGHGQTMF